MSKILDQLKADHVNICKLLCIMENQIQLLQDGVRGNIHRNQY